MLNVAPKRIRITVCSKLSVNMASLSIQCIKIDLIAFEDVKIASGIKNIHFGFWPCTPMCEALFTQYLPKFCDKKIAFDSVSYFTCRSCISRGLLH